MAIGASLPRPAATARPWEPTSMKGLEQIEMPKIRAEHFKYLSRYCSFCNGLVVDHTTCNEQSSKIWHMICIIASALVKIKDVKKQTSSVNHFRVSQSISSLVKASLYLDKPKLFNHSRTGDTSMTCFRGKSGFTSSSGIVNCKKIHWSLVTIK